MSDNKRDNSSSKSKRIEYIILKPKIANKHKISDLVVR